MSDIAVYVKNPQSITVKPSDTTPVMVDVSSINPVTVQVLQDAITVKVSPTATQVIQMGDLFVSNSGGGSSNSYFPGGW